jgi:hypothetical protein
MTQPAQSILRKHAPRDSRANSIVGGSLPQPKTRAVLVVVADVLRKQTFQMAFIHGNDMIQQISSAALSPTLRYTILPRAFEGRSYWAQLEGSNGHGDLHPVLRIAVEDEKPRSQLKRETILAAVAQPTG